MIYYKKLSLMIMEADWSQDLQDELVSWRANSGAPALVWRSGNQENRWSSSFWRIATLKPRKRWCFSSSLKKEPMSEFKGSEVRWILSYWGRICLIVLPRVLFGTCFTQSTDLNVNLIKNPSEKCSE